MWRTSRTRLSSRNDRLRRQSCSRVAAWISRRRGRAGPRRLEQGWGRRRGGGSVETSGDRAVLGRPSGRHRDGAAGFYLFRGAGCRRERPRRDRRPHAHMDCRGGPPDARGAGAPHRRRSQPARSRQRRGAGPRPRPAHTDLRIWRRAVRQGRQRSVRLGVVAAGRLGRSAEIQRRPAQSGPYRRRPVHPGLRGRPPGRFSRRAATRSPRIRQRLLCAGPRRDLRRPGAKTRRAT